VVVRVLHFYDTEFGYGAKGHTNVLKLRLSIGVVSYVEFEDGTPSSIFRIAQKKKKQRVEAPAKKQAEKKPTTTTTTTTSSSSSYSSSSSSFMVEVFGASWSRLFV
jgi:hypothetical protein